MPAYLGNLSTYAESGIRSIASSITSSLKRLKGSGQARRNLHMFIDRVNAREVQLA